MSRFIRIGNTLVNLVQVRNVEYISPMRSSGSHKIRINYSVPQASSGNFFFFTGMDNYDTWKFDSEKEAESFLDRVEIKIKSSSF